MDIFCITTLTFSVNDREREWDRKKAQTNVEARCWVIWQGMQKHQIHGLDAKLFHPILSSYFS